MKYFLMIDDLLTYLYLITIITSPQKSNKMAEGQNSFSLKYIIYGALGLFVVYNMFFKSNDSGSDYVEETLEIPTQGINLELEETEKDLFKITDEEIIEQRADSRIIASFLDGSIDTFSLDEVTLTQANDPRRSLIKTAAYAGLFGYMMGRPMSAGVSRGAYASDNAYNKSNSAGRNQIRSTSRKSTVRRPTSSKSYGGGKSTKSYGG